MRDGVDITRVWTPWELHGSCYALDWIASNAGQPAADYDPCAALTAPLTVWELSTDDRIAGDLIRTHAHRMN